MCQTFKQIMGQGHSFLMASKIITNLKIHNLKLKNQRQESLSYSNKALFFKNHTKNHFVIYRHEHLCKKIQLNVI